MVSWVSLQWDIIEASSLSIQGDLQQYQMYAVSRYGVHYAAYVQRGLMCAGSVFVHDGFICIYLELLRVCLSRIIARVLS